MHLSFPNFPPPFAIEVMSALEKTRGREGEREGGLDWKVGEKLRYIKERKEVGPN